MILNWFHYTCMYQDEKKVNVLVNTAIIDFI
jgi:hypothetical protein